LSLGKKPVACTVPYWREFRWQERTVKSQFTLATTVLAKHADPVNSTSLSINAWSTPPLSPLVRCFNCSKPNVKFMLNFNRTEHYSKQLYYLTRTNTTALQPNVFSTWKHRLLTYLLTHSPRGA
jgi:hypothetical protein